MYADPLFPTIFVESFMNAGFGWDFAAIGGCTIKRFEDQGRRRSFRNLCDQMFIQKFMVWYRNVYEEGIHPHPGPGSVETRVSQWCVQLRYNGSLDGFFSPMPKSDWGPWIDELGSRFGTTIKLRSVEYFSTDPAEDSYTRSWILIKGSFTTPWKEVFKTLWSLLEYGNAIAETSWRHSSRIIRCESLLRNNAGPPPRRLKMKVKVPLSVFRAFWVARRLHCLSGACYRCARSFYFFQRYIDKHFLDQRRIISTDQELLVWGPRFNGYPDVNSYISPRDLEDDESDSTRSSFDRVSISSNSFLGDLDDLSTWESDWEPGHALGRGSDL